ncbi:TolC family protein [Fimbriiglobus ruber]|uniref:Heavy metal RND efflux outer membrane protein, CzcC family n=1 Tax=Fimbriiglobus ruber TaxID=1908690 RepID=A0A225E5G7_9BACT|nr:TolC family protein [Fimbriiglobus ruber]OWK43667.1 Heavy metal RND efflux outer membrane protein, CzcC family [Fimbriiglobus ruber]
MRRWFLGVSAVAGTVVGGGCAQPGRPDAAVPAIPPEAVAPVAPREPRTALKPAAPPAVDAEKPAGDAKAADAERGQAPAVPESPLTLDYLEDLALQINPILRRDLAQIAAARGQAIQAGLWANPMYNTGNPLVFNGRQSLMNVGFTQEIPLMGKKKLERAAAEQNTQQQQWTAIQDRFALLTAVRTQFYQVLADQRRIEVLTELVETARQSYDAGVKKRKAGEATEVDVLLLQVNYQQVLATLRGAQALLDGDRKRLGAIVGVPGVAEWPVDGKLTTAYPAFDEDRLLRYVANDHSSIKNARAVVAQNQLLVRRAEVEPYPNPTIGPAYQFGLVPGNDQYWLNLTFNLPTWDRNQGNIMAAKANLAMSIAQVETVRNDLVNQASSVLGQYRAARAQVDEFERNILPKSTEALRLVQDGYSKGILDRATLLQAQTTVIQNNSAYVDALQNLWSNATQVAGLLQQEKFLQGSAGASTGPQANPPGNTPAAPAQPAAPKPGPEPAPAPAPKGAAKPDAPPAPAPVKGPEPEKGPVDVPKP